MSGTIGTLLIGRLVAAIATLWFVATMVFVITNLLPGDVAQELLGQSATPEAVAGLRKALGLDVPPIERYLAWLGGLIRGDFGRSLVNQMPVAQLIGSRLGNSLLLAGITALVAVPLALALGIAAAVKRGSIYDRAIGWARCSPSRSLSSSWLRQPYSSSPCICDGCRRCRNSAASRLSSMLSASSRCR